MSDTITIEYQTIRGLERKLEFSPRGGSTHWSRVIYEKNDGEWEPIRADEVKHPELVDND